jgi:RNA-binding protein YhbY
MEEETKKRLDAQDELLVKIYKSVEKTRKYFLWTLIISLGVFILPFIGLVFVLPKFLSIYTQTLGGF